MKITFKATAVELTSAVKSYLERKLGKIGKLLRKFEEEGEVRVGVEIARLTRHHRRGPVFMAEANIYLPGGILRAVQNGADVKTAIDGLESKLRLGVEKYKSRKIEHPRRERRRSN